MNVFILVYLFITYDLFVHNIYKEKKLLSRTLEFA